VSLLFRVQKLANILRISVWRRALLRFGVAAGTEHARVLGSLGQIRAVADIGANRGQFALAARYCFPEARIVSFEPLPGPAAIYRKVFSGDAEVKLWQVAIGPQSGEAVIHISGRDDSSSLLPISAEQERIFPGTAGVGIANIKISTLSDCLSVTDLPGPAMLKLDVQGFELDSLKGCEDLLGRFDWIYAECSFRELYKGQATVDEVIAWLRERGFPLCGLYNASYDASGYAVQADFLFGKGISG
jgi:FkbM family methyltransferase